MRDLVLGVYVRAPDVWKTPTYQGACTHVYLEWLQPWLKPFPVQLPLSQTLDMGSSAETRDFLATLSCREQSVASACYQPTVFVYDTVAMSRIRDHSIDNSRVKPLPYLPFHVAMYKTYVLHVL